MLRRGVTARLATAKNKLRLQTMRTLKTPIVSHMGGKDDHGPTGNLTSVAKDVSGVTSNVHETAPRVERELENLLNFGC